MINTSTLHQTTYKSSSQLITNSPMMCAWLLLSATTQDRRHLSSLWEKSTSFGGFGKVGGLTTDWLSLFILSNNLLLWPQKESLLREGEPVLSVVLTTGGWLSFMFSRRSDMPTSRHCFPFFGTSCTSSFRDNRGCAFRDGTDPNENEVLVFLLLSLSSLISAASRESYTLLKDVVVFLAYWSTFQLKWF